LTPLIEALGLMFAMLVDGKLSCVQTPEQLWQMLVDVVVIDVVVVVVGV
jgi:hypothetical protein